jgi:hypothetical protein
MGTEGMKGGTAVGPGLHAVARRPGAPYTPAPAPARTQTADAWGIKIFVVTSFLENSVLSIEPAAENPSFARRALHLSFWAEASRGGGGGRARGTEDAGGAPRTPARRGAPANRPSLLQPPPPTIPPLCPPQVHYNSIYPADAHSRLAVAGPSFLNGLRNSLNATLRAVLPS